MVVQMNDEIGSKVVWLESVDSTNKYAARFTVDIDSHGIVVATSNQTNGRGQRGNTWESAKGDNLLFSVVLKPSFLQVHKQFLISKVAALAMVELLAPYVTGLSIKWPNDIYVENRKIAGILIEHSFHSEMLGSTIVGIGLNVNQAKFSDTLPNPTSLFIETGKHFELKTLLNDFSSIFQKYYSLLQHGQIANISTKYFSELYRRDGYNYFVANGKTFKANIVGVRDTGELVLETETGQQMEFAFKEVAFVL